MQYPSLKTFAVSIVLFTAHAAFAQKLLLEQPIPPPVNGQTGFLVPNETYPRDGKPVFDRNQGGAYIAVGTERGFIGAALSKANRLVLTDIGVSVVRFNRINTALLKISKNRQDYVELRLRSTAEDWSKRSSSLDPEDAAQIILRQKATWKWWQKKVRKNRIFASLATFSTDRKTGLVPFEGASYLVDDILFNRLHALAQADRIEAHLMDLEQRSNARMLSNRMQELNEKIGILDLSNTWDECYLELHGVTRLIRAFSDVMTAKSLVLLTDMRHITGWSYNGVSYRYLTQHGDLRFLKSIYDTFEEPSAWNISCTMNGTVMSVVDADSLDPEWIFDKTSKTDVFTRLLVL